jgi:PKHD-type hydroxylase
MLVEIPAVLDTDKLAEIHKLLAGAPFVEGKLSAGQVAQPVKNNEEVSPAAAQLNRLNHLVMGTLVQHPIFQNAALPHRVAVPFYARYAVGKAYGDHIDDPLMGPPGQRYRSDVSVTVFLNSPTDYDGGELVIRTSYGEQQVKCAAGHAILYPSSSLHHVNPVTHGVRLVAVTWVQSVVRDPAKRELLYGLNRVREALLRAAPEDENSKQLDRSYVNLVRMWAEL